MGQRPFQRWFLSAEPSSTQYYQDTMYQTVQMLLQHVTRETKSFSGTTPMQAEERLRTLFGESVSKNGKELHEVLQNVRNGVMEHTFQIHNPVTMAHLQCPPLVPSLAAEVVLTALNQSMDSWDQSGAATTIEQQMVRWLCEIYHMDEGDGIFTTGGTQSNYMGVLLAREAVSKKRWGWDVKQKGLHPNSSSLRILCSAEAHFTCQQSAAELGLGEQAVVPIPTDDTYKMSIPHLEKTIQSLKEEGLIPFLLFGTAGTTDFGSIDPLEEMASIASEHDMWYHVDAAYGGALQLSKQHGSKLKGVEQADSLTVDFHKMFYQPISCGAFLVKQANSFHYLTHHADYLNPEQDEEDGIPNLVQKSVMTTRRFDALKLFMSLQVVGTETLASMINSTLINAQYIASQLEQEEAFQLIHEPEINAVVFRLYQENWSEEQTESINLAVRNELLNSGKAIIARTRINGKVHLKVTILNPTITTKDIEEVIEAMKIIAGQEAGKWSKTN
ncbi:pyridoxal phosphate-dependent decarboxylase family protein [Pontibacillus salicampi]|uniref:Pyridoxal phosphate-dependent decarboxylase family protein n=1 Tax=Pontibacillus salicampi TaxID=1449801 RepID=A0ABV6LPV0_9BACI